MDFGFENLVADWNGVDRPTVNELSEEKVHTRGPKKLAQQAEPSKKKRRNLPLVSLHRISDIQGRALFIRSPVSNQFRMSGICNPCRRGYIPICFTPADGSTSTVQLLHSSAPSCSYYPDHGTTIYW